VVSLRRTSRRGVGGFGCLVSLALFVAALYYGFYIGQIYFRYHQLLDSMRTQARLAPTLDDEAIHRRLGVEGDSLFPGRSPRFKITRGGHPNRITITTEYTERIDLPLFKHTFVLRPRAEEAL
jgi:hypothetical protein